MEETSCLSLIVQRQPIFIILGREVKEPDATSLQERLDPIDWAIYAMYLWKGETLFFQRIKILCGSLLYGNRAHSQV